MKRIILSLTLALAMLVSTLPVLADEVVDGDNENVINQTESTSTETEKDDEEIVEAIITPETEQTKEEDKASEKAIKNELDASDEDAAITEEEEKDAKIAKTNPELALSNPSKYLASLHNIVNKRTSAIVHIANAVKRAEKITNKEKRDEILAIANGKLLTLEAEGKVLKETILSLINVIKKDKEKDEDDTDTSPEPSATPTATPTASPEPSATPTATPTVSPEPSATPTATPIVSPVPTSTVTSSKPIKDVKSDKGNVVKNKTDIEEDSDKDEIDEEKDEIDKEKDTKNNKSNIGSLIKKFEKQEKAINELKVKIANILTIIDEDDQELLLQEAEQAVEDKDFKKAAAIYNYLAGHKNGVKAETFDKAASEVKKTEKEGPKVYIKGKRPDFDVKPFIKDNRTMLPMRKVAESLGAEVLWDSATNTATFTKGEIIVKITVGEKSIEVNGVKIEIDTAAIIVDDRIMVPARAISEAFNCQVDYDPDTEVINIEENVVENNDSEDLIAEAQDANIDIPVE